MKTYDVVVTREGRSWLADVPAVPGCHTWARTLTALDAAVREAISLAEDLPDGAEASLDLDWDLRTGDPEIDATGAALRARRRCLRTEEAAVSKGTADYVALIVSRGFSVRETARLAGVSHQRVSQLTATTAAPAGGPSSSRRPRATTSAGRPSA